MAVKGKRCNNCGQVNPADETICISCKSEDGLKEAEVKSYLVGAFDSKEDSRSAVANVLSFIAYTELICAPIVGLSFAQSNGNIGWAIFISGIIGGLIFLGFSKIIQYLYDSVRYLQKIESLLRTIAK